MTTEAIKISEGGEITAIIVLAPDANAQICHAASILEKYLQLSTSGQMLRFITTDPDIPHDKNRIYIGVLDPEIELNAESALNGLGDDGFVIYPQGNSISIIGNTSWGTEYGVLEFLERYVGVCWLMPGPDGEDVPRHTDISIPVVIVRDAPQSISRHFFGTDKLATSTEWARRNRMHDMIQFHHNMSVLFDTEFHADHAEYYPDGVLPDHPDNWQPSMNDTTANAAIQRIITYFERNPDELSYSLGINDSQNYCEANPAHPLYTGKLNSIGYLDMSDVYYPWINKIVAGVTEKFPDKYFGLLAYWNVYDPPTNVKLHPRIVPYITDDRMTWIDPVKRLEGHDHTERWKKAADHLAFYEYLYGTPYCVPRVYIHRMAENYKYARNTNVIAHVAELFPNFGEGPKPWISAKLQWNPFLNIEDLLSQWYIRTVGIKAASYLREYFEYWEYFWETRIFKTKWYRKWADSPIHFNFLDLFDSSYLQAVTDDDMAKSRRLMEKVVLHAETDAQKKRAHLLMSTFEYYEDSVLSYMRTNSILCPTNNQEVAELLFDSSRTVSIAKRRLQGLKVPQVDPILVSPSDLFSFDGVWIWRGTERALSPCLAQWLKHTSDPEEFIQQLKLYGNGEEQTDLRDYARFMLAELDQGENLLHNHSICTRPAKNSPNETIQWDWSENALTKIRTGICRLQEVHLEPGCYGVVIRLNVTDEMALDATINWYFQIANGQGEIVDSIITGRIPLITGKGDEITLEAMFEVVNEPCKVPLVFQVYEIKPDERLDLEISHFALYRLN
ncbi:hypothetical protein Back11_55710 [Paenibacillus baekrokdamisoli]|uniref:Uncharacterized protein n=1 Tax=Paenibacillus baekrokdamisoli TaxID=1712516 RepID=A0A3G9J0E2_9BACL|nr:DUF4838 domain-containing protein [Paenibacillus baekrokdamisoli]MBB3071792.1 hypothetical protein [Paenibacillus baekrokdamisoli]BBH24226.1 hypothetical protein Back11_55710 [Paenibacillus baekrokdamisoli]